MRRTPTQAMNAANAHREELMEDAEYDPVLKKEYFDVEEETNKKLYTRRGPIPKRRDTKKRPRARFSDDAIKKPPAILDPDGTRRPGQPSRAPPTPTQAPPQPSALEDDLFGETNILGEVVTNEFLSKAEVFNNTDEIDHAIRNQPICAIMRTGGMWKYGKIIEHNRNNIVIQATPNAIKTYTYRQIIGNGEFVRKLFDYKDSDLQKAKRSYLAKGGRQQSRRRQSRRQHSRRKRSRRQGSRGQGYKIKHRRKIYPTRRRRRLHSIRQLKYR